MSINFPSTTNQATDGSFTHTDSTAGITWTWDGTSWSAGGVGGSGGASDTATYASTAGIATYASTAGVSTAAQGLSGTPNLNVGIVTATSFSGSADLSGLLRENVKITAGKLSDNTDIDVGHSMVHLFTPLLTETTTSSPNIRYDSSTTLNDSMNIGESIAVTIITKAAAAAYCTQLLIDGLGTSASTHWVGGAAPSAGGSSGVDIYSFNIIKTANAQWTIIASLTKTS